MNRKFTRTFQVPATLSQVSLFHQSPQTLRLLTPPPVFVQFHHIDPLAEGSISDFTLWLGPVPIHWIAIHSEVDPLTGFTDTQLSGPYSHWKHRHLFKPVKSSSDTEDNTILTEITDEIEATPGKGLWNGLISRLLLLGLPMMFAYRAWRTRRTIMAENHF